MNLYGASGHCKVIIDILEKNNCEITAIYDDNVSIDKILDYKVYSLIEDFNEEFIITIGNNATRKKTVQKLNCNFGKAIHPGAIISNYTSIGEGTVIMAGAIISSDVKIGKHTIMNHNSSIDHDCIIGDFVHISPGVLLAGNVQIGEGSHIGIGAQIIQEVTVGKWCIIGAGTVVTKDVPDFAVMVGNPGKIIKFNNIEYDE